MKRILITGKESYIGTKVQKWLEQYPEKYQVEVLDMIGDAWENFNFHGFDSVYHVAGIAHRNDAPDELYEQVNHVLAVKTAKKVAEAGIKQFIFMSSGAVYFQSDKKHKNLIADEDTAFNPETAYGISKMKAEKDIMQIKGNMKVAILRPPTVYGIGAKGNYAPLAKIAKKSPFFPKINNTRSMIYIDNLCEFVRLVIDNEAEGVFLPQNAEYVNTSEMVRMIAEVNKHKIWITPIFNWLIRVLGLMHDSVNKAVGTYYYRDRTYFDNKYRLVGFRESIEMIEKCEAQKRRECNE